MVTGLRIIVNPLYGLSAGPVLWRGERPQMIESYFFIKWLHIVSVAVLFGFGAGTAYYFWAAHRTRDPHVIASVGRMVVRADWIFTGTSGVVQPVTGLMLVQRSGIDPFESWLVASYLLYVLAFVCWIRVVALQIKAQRLAHAAVLSGSALGRQYRRAMWLWFLLGWPAFLGLLCVFWLMIARPTLWT
jgi:uncharacterized membrane protein